MTSFLLFILGVLFAATVYLTIEVSTLGSVLASLEQEEGVLLRERNLLANELVKASSLSEYKKKAKELGFSTPSNIVYLSGEEVVAKLP